MFNIAYYSSNKLIRTIYVSISKHFCTWLYKKYLEKDKKQAEKDEIVKVFTYDRWNRIHYPSKLVNIIFLWNCFPVIDFHRYKFFQLLDGMFSQMVNLWYFHAWIYFDDAICLMPFPYNKYPEIASVRKMEWVKLSVSPWTTNISHL